MGLRTQSKIGGELNTITHFCLTGPLKPNPNSSATWGMNVTQSKKGAELIYKYPILLDACANEMQRVGDPMMTKWAEV